MSPRCSCCSEAPVAPSTVDPSTDESALIGTWTAPASSLLGASTANVGGPGGLTDCAGDIVMTFADNGTLSRAGDVTCTAGVIQADGTISTTASYATTSPGMLSVADTVTLGMAQIGGQEIPFPDSWGDGEATYSIDGATLSIVFDLPAVGEVTQTYTRI